MFNWLKKAAGEKAVPKLGSAPDGSVLKESIALKDRGNVHLGNNELEEATACYRQAIELNPNFAEAYSNLALVLASQNNLNEAERCCQLAIKIKPNLVQAHYNLGSIFFELYRLDKSESCFRRVIQLEPEYQGAHYYLGKILFNQRSLSEAADCFRMALRIDPNDAEAHNNLGIVFHDLNLFDEAEQSFRQAIKIKSEYVESYHFLGVVLRGLGRASEAESCLRQALILKPDFVEVRWLLAIIYIPLIADTDDEIAKCRARLMGEIDGLNEWFNTERLASGYRAVGTFQPFYLAYQEENNRDFLSRYRKLCFRLMKHWQDNQGIRLPGHLEVDKVDNAILKVGIVSAHIHSHSVWDAIVKGWFEHLDPNRVELHVFHVGSQQDNETRWAKSRSASFTQGKVKIEEWAAAILEKQPDVIIYPEIGMDPTTVKLANMRFAKVQMASWGHPETTGLPTIDYYLSAEYLEPSDAEKNYTEQLVRLPNLGCHYHSLGVKSLKIDLASMGINISAALLLCPGVPFKYAPQQDRVFVEIAQRLGRCQFVFFKHEKNYLSNKLHQRLVRTFADAGMKFDEYGVFIPWLDKPAFFGLMKRSSVFLDTIGFSGFNTAMQSVESGLPVVTREGLFMRGRLASGILRRMGMEELIADTEDEYINLVVKLVQDEQYMKSVRQRFERSRSVLFDDIEPVHALEDFLFFAVGRAGQNSGRISRPSDF